jgi:ComF family protein
LGAKKSFFLRMLHKVVDVILPPRCFVTGDIVGKNGSVSPDFWKKLTFISKPFCYQCGLPFEFTSQDNDFICGRCSQNSPAFDRSRSALVYDDESKSMILAFKHGDQCHAAISFVQWLKTAGQDMIANSDIITPVPLHRWRLWQRRYNQAALLVDGLVKDNHDIVPIVDLLIRDVNTVSQGYMKQKQRQKNVAGAFSINQKYVERIKGKTILIVDDVFTTGSTLNACAKVLKKAGAEQVYTLCLARVA